MNTDRQAKTQKAPTINETLKKDEEIKSKVIKRLYSDFQNEMGKIEKEQEKLQIELNDLKKAEIIGDLADLKKDEH